MLRYFVKDGKIHSYPVPMNCDVEYDGERIYDYITDAPPGNEMCLECSISLGDVFIDSINQLTEETISCWSDLVDGIFRKEVEKSEV